MTGLGPPHLSVAGRDTTALALAFPILRALPERRAFVPSIDVKNVIFVYERHLATSIDHKRQV